MQTPLAFFGALALLQSKKYHSPVLSPASSQTHFDSRQALRLDTSSSLRHNHVPNSYSLHCARVGCTDIPH